LLDEPVSALDHETREAILLELTRIQRRTATTTIHVCHDLDEMRTVADRVGILRQGRLVQAGHPQEISQRPTDPEVASLFRLGTVLFGTASQSSSGARLKLGDLVLVANVHAEGDVRVLIRAREVRLRPVPSNEQHVVARVESVLWGDSTVRVGLRTGSTLFRAEMPLDEAEAVSIKEGADFAAICPPEAIYIFPQAPEGP